MLKNGTYDAQKLNELSLEKLFNLKSSDKNVNNELAIIANALENQLRVLEGLKNERINRLKKGDVLPSGVIKMVKVYIAAKRHVSVGDKLAGRHGNKGVVSIIVPREDMPCMEDGTPVDIVLNPVGVPSRMNVGQILETALGMVGRRLGQQLNEQLSQATYASTKKMMQELYGQELVDNYESKYGKDGLQDFAARTAQSGVKFETPVFEGARLSEDIMPLMKQANVPVAGSFKLRDGRTGDYFDQPVTVGSIYMIKLNHMVDDKLHARSVGPYSLVTQQPLGGKAQMGGQRLGEMEVWALEA